LDKSVWMGSEEGMEFVDPLSSSRSNILTVCLLVFLFSRVCGFQVRRLSIFRNFINLIINIEIKYKKRLCFKENFTIAECSSRF
jgi:hypothetical protein